MPEPVCPKCSGTMERGLYFDQVHGGVDTLGWIPGDDLPRMKLSLTGPLLSLKGELYDVHAYRCRGCGFLESYATARDSSE